MPPGVNQPARAGHAHKAKSKAPPPETAYGYPAQRAKIRWEKPQGSADLPAQAGSALRYIKSAVREGARMKERRLSQARHEEHEHASCA